MGSARPATTAPGPGIAPTAGEALEPFLTALIADPRPTPVVLATLVVALVERDGLAVDPSTLPLTTAEQVDADILAALPPVAAADLVGVAHEARLSAAHRQRRGVFYTPTDVAAGVAGMIDWSHCDMTVCDPAVGAGAFLLAAARRLEQAGGARQRIVADQVFGVDIDPQAVVVARTALTLWAAEAGASVDQDRLQEHLVVGDSLAAGSGVIAAGPPDGFSVVIGNPPFLNQLGRATARTPEDTARLRARFGDAAFRYTDAAALFLLESCRWAQPGGQISLVLPASVLVAADARGARDAVLDHGRLDALWLAGEAVFAVPVRVCAPVVRRWSDADLPDLDRVHDDVVRRSTGRDFGPAPAATVSLDELRGAGSWAALTTGLRSVPAVTLRSRGTLADLCRATAGFRDQFYGIAPYVHEGRPAGDGDDDRQPEIRLVTSGLIEPARDFWGDRTTRFAGTRWQRPVLDLPRLRGEAAPALVEWTERRLVPKVVVATQTRVLEAAIDHEGTWFPSVPTIALEPLGDRASATADLGRILAVTLAPAVTAWAFGLHAGAALSDDALKLSARQLLDTPLPADEARWRQAVEPLGRATGATDEGVWHAALVEAAHLLGAAYGLAVDDPVTAWWVERLPTWDRRHRRRGQPPAGHLP